MKLITRSNQKKIVTVIGLALTLCVANTWAEDIKGKNNVPLIPPSAYAFGKSYHEWSAEWWKWQLRLPASDHPAFDTTGEKCGLGQSGKVWFLTGAFTTEVEENPFNTIDRECEIPTGVAVFFPIINVECSTDADDPFKLILDDNGNEVLDEDGDSCAAKFINGKVAVVKDLSVVIDGVTVKNLEKYRFESPVYDVVFEDPDDNILGIDCEVVDCNNIKSKSDGYWIMIPPLSIGEHTIQFTGSFRDPVNDDLFFGLDVTYELEVIQRNKNPKLK